MQNMTLYILLLSFFFISVRSDNDVKTTLIGSLGCSAGCKYQPQNFMQLQLCRAQAQAIVAKSTVPEFYACGMRRTEQSCTDLPACAWIHFDEKFQTKFGSGVCTLHAIKETDASYYDTILPLEATKEGNGEGTFFHQAQCLAMSWSKSECDLKDECSWCDDIDKSMYEWVPKTGGICSSKAMLDEVCDQSKKESQKQLCPPSLVRSLLDNSGLGFQELLDNAMAGAPGAVQNAIEKTKGSVDYHMKTSVDKLGDGAASSLRDRLSLSNPTTVSPTTNLTTVSPATTSMATIQMTQLFLFVGMAFLCSVF